MAQLSRTNGFVVASLSGFEEVLVLTATVYIFSRRSLKTIPCVVTVQMVLLNIYSACLVAYNVIVILNLLDTNAVVASQTPTANLIATFGDLCFLIHDWLFTE